jgi:hypothetical protein
MKIGFGIFRRGFGAGKISFALTQTRQGNILEVLQLCRNSVVGWQDAPPGLCGLWSIQVAPI